MNKSQPVSVFDVADYILRKRGSMSAMKLQKLSYYCQAWSLVWDGEPLFSGRIEAWKDGPVQPALWAQHKGQFHVSRVKGGDAAKLSKGQRETVDAVLDTYGSYDGGTLGRMTHEEDPWVKTRGDLPEGAACQWEIPHDLMKSFYGSL